MSIVAEHLCKAYGHFAALDDVSVKIETGQLVDTYARSKFEDTRRKAEKFGARGTTVKAYKPVR